MDSEDTPDGFLNVSVHVGHEKDKVVTDSVDTPGRLLNVSVNHVGTSTGSVFTDATAEVDHSLSCSHLVSLKDSDVK